MTALIDTHAVLWFLVDDPRLSTVAKNLIESDDRLIYCSSVVAAEMSIKHGRGKLTLPESPKTLLPKLLFEMRMFGLQFNVSHGSRIGELPDLHRDPFDRMLITQALYEKLPIITSDSRFAGYGVTTIW